MDMDMDMGADTNRTIFDELIQASHPVFVCRNGRIPPLPRGYSQALTSVIKSMLNLNVCHYFFLFFAAGFFLASLCVSRFKTAFRFVWFESAIVSFLLLWDWTWSCDRGAHLSPRGVLPSSAGVSTWPHMLFFASLFLSWGYLHGYASVLILSMFNL